MILNGLVKSFACCISVYLCLKRRPRKAIWSPTSQRAALPSSCPSDSFGRWRKRTALEDSTQHWHCFEKRVVAATSFEFLNAEIVHVWKIIFKKQFKLVQQNQCRMAGRLELRTCLISFLMFPIRYLTHAIIWEDQNLPPKPKTIHEPNVLMALAEWSEALHYWNGILDMLRTVPHLKLGSKSEDGRLDKMAWSTSRFPLRTLSKMVPS